MTPQCIISLCSDEEKEEICEVTESIHPFSRSVYLSEIEIQTRLTSALGQFGFTALRGLQESAIQSVLAEEDTLVLMPTGGGKSLCFQLPALILDKLVIVVSPLLALMQDQVQALRGHGIEVEMLCSLVTSREKDATYARLLRDSVFTSSSNRIKLLYTTPETLSTLPVLKLLSELYERHYIALFAIDEAHCISSWGHDFRPTYHRLGELRLMFPRVPMMALTATATYTVQQDIIQHLNMSDNVKIFRTDFNRPNITYTVVLKDELGNDPTLILCQFIKRCHEKSTGIIYVHKRSEAEELSNHMMILDAHLRVTPYHAKMKLCDREKTLNDWLEGKVRIVCATIAFGMGIDHPHVRFVIHWNMPKTLENMYQESGRAGRDGDLSHSILMYSSQDFSLYQYVMTLAKQNLQQHKRLTDQEKEFKMKQLEQRRKELGEVQSWALGRKGCRRQGLLMYFGQEIKMEMCQGTCDICSPSTMAFDRLAPIPSLKDVVSMKSSNSQALVEIVSSEEEIEWNLKKDMEEETKGETSFEYNTDQVDERNKRERAQDHDRFIQRRRRKNDEHEIVDLT